MKYLFEGRKTRPGGQKRNGLLLVILVFISTKTFMNNMIFQVIFCYHPNFRIHMVVYKD